MFLLNQVNEGIPNGVVLSVYDDSMINILVCIILGVLVVFVCCKMLMKKGKAKTGTCGSLILVGFLLLTTALTATNFTNSGWKNDALETINNGYPGIDVTLEELADSGILYAVGGGKREVGLHLFRETAVKADAYISEWHPIEKSYFLIDGNVLQIYQTVEVESSVMLE